MGIKSVSMGVKKRENGGKEREYGGKERENGVVSTSEYGGDFHQISEKEHGEDPPAKGSSSPNRSHATSCCLYLPT
jgi:hypothetical protein